MADYAPFGPDPPQDLDALGRSLPERTEPPSFFGPDAQSNPLRRTVEAPFRALQYALTYPQRVWGRYDHQQTQAGHPPSFPGPRADGSRSGDLYPILAQQLAPTLSSIDAMDPHHNRYVPGERESDNVLDNRAKSIWQYR